MNDKAKCTISFVSGVITGAVGVMLFTKKKWQKEFDSKRDEMIRYYESKKETVKEETVNEVIPEVAEPKETEAKDILRTDKDKQEVEESEKIIQRFNYAKISTPERTKNEAPILNDESYSKDPYEIDGREFGTQEMYGMVTLYFYDDGELLTEKYELLNDDDVENYIGSKLLEKFAALRDSDPELDSFYVRNDRLKTDYEIIVESGRYEE